MRGRSVVQAVLATLGFALGAGWLGAGILLAQAEAEPAIASAQGRVIVLGIDGMDHAVVSEAIAMGQLPELARLAEEGGFRRLIPTNPAQSPTAWATLFTGKNPGHTGIFGFTRRAVRDGEVVAELALAEKGELVVWSSARQALAWCVAVLLLLLPLLIWRKRRPRFAWTCGVLLAGTAALAIVVVGRELPGALPVPKSLMTGDPIWSALDAEGVPATSLFPPMAFPAPPLQHGHLLCGLGVPDLAASAGSVVVYRDGAAPGGRLTQMGGKEIPLVPRLEGPGFEDLTLYGPTDPKSGERLGVPLSLARNAETGRIHATLDGQSVELPETGFSPFLPVRFGNSWLLPQVHGLVRLHALPQEPGSDLGVYQEPVQFDPRRPVPVAPLSSPKAWAGELAADGGLFETLGWATATNPYQDELIDEEVLLADIAGIERRREAMVLAQLEKPDWKLFLAVLYTPDRLGHVFWADRDPEHPAHDPEAAARRGDLVLASYQRVDALIGTIRRKHLRPEDALVVVSDHGFAPFRRAVNLNRWLMEQGWMSARADGARNLARDLGGDAYRHVDWSKTKAYHLGLGRIWLNLKGREPQGIVEPEEAPALLEEIRRRLLALEDEGQRAIRSVKTREELYSGPRVSEASDLVIGFERGWRVSCDSCLGGVGGVVFEDNLSRWSGDHCSVDPELVPGVLFANRRLRAGPAAATDLYPTLRALLGLAVQRDLDGISLIRAPGVEPDAGPVPDRGGEGR